MLDRAALGTAVLELTTDDRKLEKGLGEAEKKSKGFGSKIGGIAKVALLGVAAGGVAVGGALLKIGSDFDEAFDTIRAGTGATGKDLEGLKGDFKAVFSAVPTDMKSASTAIADLNTRLGLTGKPLQDLSKQMINLSRITKTDVGPLIASTTRVFGDWSVATEDQSGALDLLFKVSQSTGIGVDSLSTKLVQFGAPLRQVGFTMEESAALLGKWEKEGVNTEAILGALKIGVANFAKEGKDAKVGLQEFTERMLELGPGAEAVTLAVETFGSRAGPDMAAAVLEGRFSIEELMGTLDASGETINGVASDTDSWTQKLEVLKNKMLVALEPAAERVFSGLGEFIDAVSPSLETFAGHIVTGVEVLGELFGVITGSAPDAGAKLKELVGEEVAGAIMTGLATVREGFKTAFAFVRDEVLPRVTAAIDFFRRNWEQVEPVVKTVGVLIGLHFAHVAAQAVIHTGTVIAAWARTTAASLAAQVKTAAHVAFMVGRFAFMGVQALLHAGKMALAWAIAGGPITLLVALVAGLVTAVVLNWDTITKVTGELVANIGEFFGGLGTTIGEAWDGVVGTVKDAVNTIIGFINEMIGAWNGIRFTIPRIELPSVDLPFIGRVGGGSFGGETFSVPQLLRIPQLEAGGVMRSDGLAFLHAGETVTPAGGVQTIIVPVHLDGRVIAQVVAEQNRRRAGALGFGLR